MNTQLQKKVDFAIKLLQSIPTNDEIEIAYSGGKDSDVILELAKMAGIKYRAIYKNTTIDPPGTIKHCKEMGVEILNPKKTFFELVRQKGMPNRNVRFCCEELKEYKVLDNIVIGVRRAESSARKKRYKEPEMCHIYKSGVVTRKYMPILEWTNTDIEMFILERGIKCHPLYYENGKFCVNRRLGCMGCPLTSKKIRIATFIENPKFLRLWIKNAQVFLDNHPDSKSSKHFNKSAHQQMFFNLFMDIRVSEYKDYASGGLFPETAIDAKDFLENYFKIDLTI